MLPQNITALINLFNLCTLQIMRHHSSDLLSSSLSNHLILTQSNPLILENLDDKSFSNHRYPLMEKNKDKVILASQLFKVQTHSTRLSCHILLIDFNTKPISMPSQMENYNKRKTRIIIATLRGLSGFREYPTFILFQDFHFSLHHSHVVFFTRFSHTYPMKSPYIWLTASETLLFCKTCPTQFLKFSHNQLRSLKGLQLYWKKVHKNLRLAPVSHLAASSGSSKCISNGGRKTTVYFTCLYITLKSMTN